MACLSYHLCSKPRWVECQASTTLTSRLNQQSRQASKQEAIQTTFILQVFSNNCLVRTQVYMLANSSSKIPDQWKKASRGLNLFRLPRKDLRRNLKYLTITTLLFLSYSLIMHSLRREISISNNLVLSPIYRLSQVKRLQ